MNLTPSTILAVSDRCFNITNTELTVLSISARPETRSIYPHLLSLGVALMNRRGRLAKHCMSDVTYLYDGIPVEDEVADEYPF